ncbi:MAG TPA: glycosyltransferase family 4 protein [Pyrinomonadaceae bacterium]|nr:glycosyltransferase family 4 protein [Pyrinomonadaceae bacterium]
MSGLIWLLVRILQISSARAFGGGERHFVDLTLALHACGHQVYVALAPRSPLRPALDTLPAENIFTLPLRNSLDVGSAIKLSRILRERRIEILHAHVGRDYTVAALAARKTPGVRLIVTRHVLFPLGRVHALTLSRAARVIAVSEAVGRALRSQNLFPAGRLRVIQNGIELCRFNVRGGEVHRGEWRARFGAGYLIGTVGELSRVKGQEDFVRAAAVVTRECAVPVHFVVVGEDKSPAGEERARLRQMIADLQLADRVHLLGMLDGDDIPSFLSSLDVFVSASRSEAFGLAIIEAMAAGAAVAATATAGASEIVTDRVTGRIVPVGDPSKMAAAILEMLQDDDARRRLALAARAMVIRRYKLDRMIAETERAYCEALEDLHEG